MNITRWLIAKPDSLQLKMEKHYTVRKKKKDQELTVAQIMNFLSKIQI